MSDLLDLLGDLAWPAAILIIFFWLRRPILALLKDPNLRELSAGPISLRRDATERLAAALHETTERKVSLMATDEYAQYVQDPEWVDQVVAQSMDEARANSGEGSILRAGDALQLLTRLVVHQAKPKASLKGIDPGGWLSQAAVGEAELATSVGDLWSFRHGVLEGDLTPTEQSAEDYVASVDLVLPKLRELAT